MIKILISKNNQTFIITIDNKIIKYWDALEGKIWGGPLQWLPPSKETEKKIRMSRNKIPAHFLKMLIVPEDELAEWEKAKNDNELLEIVKKDLKRNYCKIIEIK